MGFWHAYMGIYGGGGDAAVPTVPGVEYTASAARPHYQALGNKRPHYTADAARPHYEAVEE